MKKIKLIELLNAFSKITFIMAVTLFLSAFLSGCTQSVSVNYYNPNWLPDGRIIAVKQHVASVQELVNPGKITSVSGWVVAMDIDGKNETLLFECNSAFFKPIVSPDGLKIASGDGIFDMSGKLLVSVPSDNGRFMSIVDWSPDSKKVVLWCGEYNKSKKYIYTYDLHSQKLKYLREGYEPAWNNDIGITYRDLDNDKMYLFVIDENSKLVNKIFETFRDAKILQNNKTVFDSLGNFRFYDIASAKLIKEIAFPIRIQPIPQFEWKPGTPTFSMVVDYYSNAKLAPNQKNILSTDDNGAGVYLTSVETGQGKFIAYKSEYKK